MPIINRDCPSRELVHEPDSLYLIVTQVPAALPYTLSLQRFLGPSSRRPVSLQHLLRTGGAVEPSLHRSDRPPAEAPSSRRSDARSDRRHAQAVERPAASG